MDNTTTAKVVMDGIQGSVGLILNKFDELIRAVGGKVEVFYPIVRKQQIIYGCSEIILLLSMPFLIWITLAFWKKDCITDDGNPTAKGIVAIILSVVGLLILLTIAFNIGDIFRLFNPDYYAVQKIIEMGKDLIGK